MSTPTDDRPPSAPAHDAPRAVVVAAPAKVNLGLRVAALRGDGHHEIDTLFATLDLADRVRVERTASGVEGTARWAGPGDADASDGGEAAGPAEARGALPPMDEDNLAWRAAETWLREAGEPGGARVELVKRIPVAAGLGGGSSDAGAVLRALAALYPGGPAPEEVAGRIGSDVPFFARGLPAARGRGRGERLTPVELPQGHLVLLNPGVAVAAAEAYGALQNFGPPQPPEAAIDALRRGLTPSWRNDLQPGVLRTRPEVRDALAALREAGLGAPTMSGSGATCLALASGAEEAASAARELARAHPSWWCVAASFPLAAEALEPREAEGPPTG